MRQKRVAMFLMLPVLLGSVALAAELPATWRQSWLDPPAAMRPMQIVHGIPADQATAENMARWKEAGVGGIVCNVAFTDYLTSEAHWETLERAVEACRQAGLRVWIYDEEGYPSGAAGGLVLRRNPSFEAQALTYDPARPEPFAVRPAYEHTHASNNFYAARRYPNLIDAEADRCFLEVTHEAYWHRLAKYFGKTIEAVFTDEPSLMAVNIGPLGDAVRKTVRVVDPLDPNMNPLPSVAWVGDLAARYQQRYGQDIMAARGSLFAGDDETDKQIRRQFWALISDLIAERYFGQIQTWARSHQIASSGHTLWEEAPLHHVPLEGNALKVLQRMDIPGLDVLSSDPEAAIYDGWLTAGLPASAALFAGGRRVMTEVSDFTQKMAGRGPADLAAMQATAAWQAALGVTEFTLYYSRLDRSVEDYRAYGDYVGRLNALLREALWAPRVLLYYPIYDLWGEYLPVAEKLTVASQSPRAQHLVESFQLLGRQLTQSQISFALVDHELLAGATVREGSLWVKSHPFEALVLPAEVQLPPSAETVVQACEAGGPSIYRDRHPGPEIDLDGIAKVYSSGTLAPPSDQIVVGRFRREGVDILLLVNVSAAAYQGTSTVTTNRDWLRADPRTRQIENLAIDRNGKADISLPARQAIFLVGLSRSPGV
ncbi:MAG: hypothetical protein JW810_06485 [Sedimentisphaerales bacterium]|nr:hypothetical protein [Sedimentisphaerales bacterium]